MSVVTTAFSSELVKISESQKKDKQPNYLKAVVAGLPVVAAQAASDVPESIIERGVQNRILKAGKLPSAGSLVNVGGVRFASRIGAGAFTTPLFVSGMGDIASAKNKKDENRGLAKIVAAGGVYAGLRGGIESAIDTEYKHMPMLDRLKRVAGPKAFRGIASAAATGVMVGRGLRKQKSEKNPSVMTRYVAPAAIGAGMSGLGGLYEAGIAEGFRTPQARWRVGAKVGGKAAAGAAATLFLSELMKKVLPGKEKKAEAVPSNTPTPANLNTQISSWARSANTPDILSFYSDIKARGGERSPSSRSAYYALHDELRRRGEKVDTLEVRDRVSGKVKNVNLADASKALLVISAPGIAFSYINSLPATDRDRVLSDALDNLYVQDKIRKYTSFEDKPLSRGEGRAYLRDNAIVISKDADPAELAHEIGHIRAGGLRKATLQSAAADATYKIGRAMSIAVPTAAYLTSLDKSYATPDELKSKANAVAAMGLVAAAAQSPVLLEEGIASTKALAYLKRSGATNSEVVEKAVKVLAPAFGTYVAPAALPFIAAALIKRRANQKVDQTK